jgi:hypothetical protein
MGRVAQKHQKEIEQVALKVEGLQDDSQIQKEILGYVESLRFRAQAGEMSFSTMLQGIMPHFWKVMSATLNREAATVRALYFTTDINTREPLQLPEDLKAIRADSTTSYQNSVSNRVENKIVLPISIWNQLSELFDSWYHDHSGYENDQVTRLILTLGFFTGRRPFSEIVFSGQFAPTAKPVRREWVAGNRYAPEFKTNFEYVSTPFPNPDWADEWVRFDGNGKPTYKEKLAGFPLPLDIPLIGTSADDVITALERLRSLLQGKSWYENQAEMSDSVVRSVLQYNLVKAQEPINEILQPLYAEGRVMPSVGGGRSNGKFSPYHLRPIYANRCAYEIAKTAEEGKADDTVVTKWILGHGSGLGSVSSYKSFEIVDR